MQPTRLMYDVNDKICWAIDDLIASLASCYQVDLSSCHRNAERIELLDDNKEFFVDSDLKVFEYLKSLYDLTMNKTPIL